MEIIEFLDDSKYWTHTKVKMPLCTPWRQIWEWRYSSTFS